LTEQTYCYAYFALLRMISRELTISQYEKRLLRYNTRDTYMSYVFENQCYAARKMKCIL